MRWLIWYLRSMFCEHDFIYEERGCFVTTTGGPSGSKRLENVVVSATCNLCGWHRSYRKFNY